MYGTKDAAQCFDSYCERTMQKLHYYIGVFNLCFIQTSWDTEMILRHLQHRLRSRNSRKTWANSYSWNTSKFVHYDDSYQSFLFWLVPHMLHKCFSILVTLHVVPEIFAYPFVNLDVWDWNEEDLFWFILAAREASVALFVCSARKFCAACFQRYVSGSRRRRAGLLQVRPNKFRFFYKKSGWNQRWDPWAIGTARPKTYGVNWRQLLRMRWVVCIYPECA